jgi:hypothetical protein
MSAAAAEFPRYFQPQIIESRENMASIAFEYIRQVSYAGFTPDMLTDLYRNAYARDVGKALGRYDTPLYVTRRIWANIPVEFVRPADRIVADLSCGWGSFLISAYERLSMLPDMGTLAMRDHIHGNDKDEFTAQLAGLGLLISTSEDSWHVDHEDASDWKWLQHARPSVIVGNPPFGGDRKTTMPGATTRKENANAFLEAAISRLAPGGYLAMLMPASFSEAEASPKLRKLLLTTCDVLELWDMSSEVFSKGATVQPMVVFAKKNELHATRSTQCVRVRTVQKKTHSAFEKLGVFTASSLVADQSTWNEKAKKSRHSTNNFLIEYHQTLPDATWGVILSQTDQLSDVADVVGGVVIGTKESKKRFRDYKNPKDAMLLGGPRIAMRSDFVIDYSRSQRITYPNSLEWPRKDKENVLFGKKILLAADPNPSWGKRVKVAIERQQHLVPNNYWAIVPDAGRNTNLTHEALAAIINWKVCNAWVVESLRNPWIKSSVVERMPIPKYLSVTDLRRLDSAAVEMEHHVSRGLPLPGGAANTIDTILKRAYALSDEVYERITTVYEWDERPELTLDTQDSSIARWSIDGVVDHVDAASGTVTLWLEGLDGNCTFPIDDKMPGWFLRANSAFRTKVSRDVLSHGGMINVNWGQFRPQNYTYLTEDELLDGLTGLFQANRSE